MGGDTSRRVWFGPGEAQSVELIKGSELVVESASVIYPSSFCSLFITFKNVAQVSHIYILYTLILENQFRCCGEGQSLCLDLDLRGRGRRVLDGGRGSGRLLGGSSLCRWGLLWCRFGLGFFLRCGAGSLAFFGVGSRRLIFGFLGCVAVLLWLVLCCG